METKAAFRGSIRRHFVATFHQPVITYRKNVHAQPTAMRSVYCVIAFIEIRYAE